MFRLIKLAAYALLGYALYEFFRGISDDHAQASGGRQSSPRKEGAHDREPARNQILTGEGRGTTVATADSTGGTTRHVVGRGVVSR